MHMTVDQACAVLNMVAETNDPKGLDQLGVYLAPYLLGREHVEARNELAIKFRDQAPETALIQPILDKLVFGHL